MAQRSPEQSEMIADTQYAAVATARFTAAGDMNSDATCFEAAGDAARPAPS